MSTLPLPPDLLARLLDYDEDDEQSSEAHFDQMEEVFAALDSTANRLGLAQAFWAEDDESVRALGFDLLAVQAHRFDWHVQPLIEAADAVPLEGAARAGLKLRRAAANALACIVDDARVLEPLLRFAADEDAVVRWQVARGIPVGIDPLPQRAVDVLTAMLRDEDSDVRDWAAFALGVRENDTPELRDALARLLFDADDNTAAEAAYALARRKDARVLPVLQRVLPQLSVGRLYFEAAGALADPELLPTLNGLKDAGLLDIDLDRAIEACGG
ncbi:HEAT repeat domain-containing protein [Actinospica sp. MGRD01-02]|uniref:HEAT repeat domain-containing protein n=1 Tax=Actinospica acidithermotolerans TaxID=2828514 RepID=A0A941IGS9_9ACTN|nr:HEAT repeat domain-containing protein [Actinospica acidithermotolerans]MBR7827745.1 HEAT repeat domain-containing protein [Actinospica acidithermotolerans]